MASFLNRLVIQILRMVRLGEEEPAFGEQAEVLGDECECEDREQLRTQSDRRQQHRHRKHQQLSGYSARAF